MCIWICYQSPRSRGRDGAGNILRYEWGLMCVVVYDMSFVEIPSLNRQCLYMLVKRQRYAHNVMLWGVCLVRYLYSYMSGRTTSIHWFVREWGRIVC